ISGYSFPKATLAKRVVTKTEYNVEDVLEGAKITRKSDTVVKEERIPFSELSSVLSTPTSVVQSIVRDSNAFVVKRLEITTEMDTIGGKMVKKKVETVHYDTV